MAGGLRYESVMEMPPGMRDRVVAQVVAKVSACAGDPNRTDAETESPCEECLRWPECNGVDREYCPLLGNDT